VSKLRPEFTAFPQASQESGFGLEQTSFDPTNLSAFILNHITLSK